MTDKQLIGLGDFGGHYILVDKEPVVCKDLEEWARFMAQDDSRRVALDEIHGVRISTVFLGLDHNWAGNGGPVLFETLITWEDHDEILRYETYQEALDGHAVILKAVKDHFEPKGITAEQAVIEHEPVWAN